MEATSRPEKHAGPPSRFMLLGGALMFLASCIGLYQLVTVAIEKIQAGKGYETYRTFWMVEFSYVGVLVALGASLLASFVALWFWWREEQQWRDLEQGYGSKGDA